MSKSRHICSLITKTNKNNLRKKKWRKRNKRREGEKEKWRRGQKERKNDRRTEEENGLLEIINAYS